MTAVVTNPKVHLRRAGWFSALFASLALNLVIVARQSAQPVAPPLRLEAQARRTWRPTCSATPARCRRTRRKSFGPAPRNNGAIVRPLRRELRAAREESLKSLRTSPLIASAFRPLRRGCWWPIRRRARRSTSSILEIAANLTKRGAPRVHALAREPASDAEPAGRAREAGRQQLALTLPSGFGSGKARRHADQMPASSVPQAERRALHLQQQPGKHHAQAASGRRIAPCISVGAVGFQSRPTAPIRLTRISMLRAPPRRRPLPRSRRLRAPGRPPRAVGAAGPARSRAARR